MMYTREYRSRPSKRTYVTAAEIQPAPTKHRYIHEAEQHQKTRRRSMDTSPHDALHAFLLENVVTRKELQCFECCLHKAWRVPFLWICRHTSWRRYLWICCHKASSDGSSDPIRSPGNLHWGKTLMCMNINCPWGNHTRTHKHTRARTHTHKHTYTHTHTHTHPSEVKEKEKKKGKAHADSLK